MRISFFYYRLCLFILLVGLLVSGAVYISDNIEKTAYSKQNEAAKCAVETIPRYVYASGRVIGIHEKTNGVLVVDTDCVEDESGKECNPSKGLVCGGDYITAVNDCTVSSKKEIVKILSSLSEESSAAIKLSLNRNNKSKEVEITPIKDKNNNLKLGIWIKDDMAGIGTMTYYTLDGRFGALGHGIGDGSTDELLDTGEGEIYTVSLSEIIKGKEGKPGELSGVIYCGTKNHIGVLANNTPLGIYGNLDKEDLKSFEEEDKCYEICHKEQIEKGEAYIVSDISGEIAEYKIMITDVDTRKDKSNDGLKFNVSDEKLINLTGGIVQGMSGSPIIQNGKIIGAVTHVLVNDPTKGYGVFIDAMLDE